MEDREWSGPSGHREWCARHECLVCALTISAHRANHAVLTARLLPPIDAGILLDELETTPVGIVEVEGFRVSRVLDRPPHLAAESSSPLQDVVEA